MTVGSIGDINYQPLIDKNTYNLNVSAASNDSAVNFSSISSGNVFVGLEFENYVTAPKDESMYQ